MEGRKWTQNETCTIDLCVNKILKENWSINRVVSEMRPYMNKRTGNSIKAKIQRELNKRKKK